MNCGYLIGKKTSPYPRERTSHSGASYLKELDSTEILCRAFQLLQNIFSQVYHPNRILCILCYRKVIRGSTWRPIQYPYLCRKHEISVQDGCLNFFQACDSLMNELLEKHPCMSKIKNLTHNYLCWPRMDSDV